jgi:hypothetical protein
LIRVAFGCFDSYKIDYTRIQPRRSARKKAREIAAARASLARGEGTVTAAGEHLGQTKKYLRVDENGLRLLV